MQRRDTIFAISSGRPPAAISVVRISGPEAHSAAERLATSLPPSRVAAVRELRDPRSGDLLDRALVLRFDSPASSTGEHVVELHCHGGRAVVDALLGVLSHMDGLREASPGEFTRRAFELGRIDLTEAEGIADLVEAETESQRKAALALAEGGLRRQIELWREDLLELAARAERAIDYDDDDVDFAPALADRAAALAAELGGWLDRPRAEPLKEGVAVVIAGPPNAGKSSLLNAIVGSDKAIVTDFPGTTRDSIEIPISLRGIPIRLTDTAGLRDASDAVEAIGVARAAKLVDAADVLIWLGEPADAPPHERLIVVQSKADLPGRDEAPPGVLCLSSVTYRGIGELLERVQSSARSVLPGDDQIVLNRRQASFIAAAKEALVAAAEATDYLLFSEHVRQARLAFDQLTGRAGVEDVLEAMFSRFCLGK